MIEYTPEGWVLIGAEGRLLVPNQDNITPKLAMLFEAQCEGRRVIETVKKFGYTKQRFYQLLHLFEEQGASALQNQKWAPRATIEEPMKTSARSSAIASSIPAPRRM